MATLEEELEKIRQEREGYSAAISNDLALSQRKPELSTEQIITGAALGILPMLIGRAVGGRKTGIAAADTGIAGMSGYAENVLNRQKNEALEADNRVKLLREEDKNLRERGESLNSILYQDQIGDVNRAEERNWQLRNREGKGQPFESEEERQRQMKIYQVKPEHADLIKTTEDLKNYSQNLKKGGEDFMELLRPEERAMVRDTSAMIESASKDIADLEKLAISFPEYQTMKRLASTSYAPLSAGVMLRARLIGSAIEKGRLTDQDAKVYDDIMTGGMTASPKDVARFMRNGLTILSEKSAGILAMAKLQYEKGGQGVLERLQEQGNLISGKIKGYTPEQIEKMRSTATPEMLEEMKKEGLIQ